MNEASEPTPSPPAVTAAAALQRLRALAAWPLTLALAIGAAVMLFSWTAGPVTLDHVPVAVAGPRAVAESGAHTLTAGRPGAFAVRLLPDGEAARRAVTERSVYGAVVIEDQGLRLLVASAASPAVAGELVSAVSAIQARSQGMPLQIEDVVPAPRHDPRGAVPASATLVLLAGAVAGAELVRRRSRTASGQLAGLLILAAGAGGAAELILHGLLGAITGPVLAEAGVLAGLVLAAAAGTAGLTAIAGLPGTALAGLVLVVLGHPVSGAASAPELVPAPWGAIGALLPSGAGSTALRDVAFFHGHGATLALSVLGGWALGGLALAAGARQPAHDLVRTPLQVASPAAGRD